MFYQLKKLAYLVWFRLPFHILEIDQLWNGGMYEDMVTAFSPSKFESETFH